MALVTKIFDFLICRLPQLLTVILVADNCDANRCAPLSDAYLFSCMYYVSLYLSKTILLSIYRDDEAALNGGGDKQEKYYVM